MYSKDEQVQKIDDIKHKPVREILKYYKINDGIEVHYDGDIPAKTGVGSSSAFCCWFFKCNNAIKKN